MSDYLGNLVMRMRSPAITVRPQVSSVFEPPLAHAQLSVPRDLDPDISIESSHGAPTDAELLAPAATHSDVRREPAHALWLSTAQASAPSEISAAPADVGTVQPPRISPRFLPTPWRAHEPMVPREEEEAVAVQPRRRQRRNALGTTGPVSGPASSPVSHLSMPRQSQPTAQDDDVERPAPHVKPRFEAIQPRLPRVAHGSGTTDPAGEEGINPPSSPPFISLDIESLAPVSPERAPISLEPAVRPPGIPRPAADPDQSRQHASVHGPAIRPLTAAARVAPQAMRAADVAPPTIHVTIGRIEVRATPPPPAQPRPRAAAAPILTLDEYLRRRASGGPQ
jgi:hypothetical protein